jgi:ribosome biogenesis protein Nip4
MNTTMNLQEFLQPFGVKRTVNAQLVGRSYFIVKEKELLSKRPLYTGECIAHVRGPVLIPSIDFLQQIAKEARKHIILNEKAEWLFICGRDVFAKGITSHNNPETGERVVILNQHKECLGYGDVIAPLDGKKVVIKRLFDIGDLLRRERKSRKVRIE